MNARSTDGRVRRRGAARWRAALIGLLLIVPLSLAACSSAGGTAAKTAATTPRLKVALITHATPGDTFWDIVRKGAQAAASKDNVQLLYSSDPDASKQAQLIQQATQQKVSAIVTTLANPPALASAVKGAEAAGIPVFGINSGITAYKGLGVLSYFGSDETLAGQTAGEEFNKLGAKNLVCVIQEQGQIALQQRCAGVKQTFNTGKFQIVYVNDADMAGVESTLAAKLQADPTIDTVLTLGAPIAAVAQKSLADAKSNAKIATFDMSAAVIQQLKEGKLEFAIDQQPYLQGYEGIDAAWLYATNRNILGGGKPVLTGPQLIFPNDADSLAKYAKAGTR